MKNFLDSYSYELPDNLIARTPAEPRDSARLLVYNIATDAIVDTVFSELAQYIPENSLLVMNETKVVPARVLLTKDSGGKVEVLFLTNELVDTTSCPLKIRGMIDRKVVSGDILSFPDGTKVHAQTQDAHIFVFTIECSYREFLAKLAQFGTTPIPRYIGDTGCTEDELRKKYQTIFASKESDAARSVAAPTASLHFTERVFESLDTKHIERASLMLHVGQGTFAPVTEEQIRDKKLHEEQIIVPEETKRTIERHITEGSKIITVGTTATRALESLTTLDASSTPHSTQLFIQPGYNFRYTDGLITNFHLPKTSLMSLVDAFLKDKGAKKNILDLYAHAIDKGYRFYSFGDALLII